LIFEGRTNS